MYGTECKGYFTLKGEFMGMHSASVKASYKRATSPLPALTASHLCDRLFYAYGTKAHGPFASYPEPCRIQRVAFRLHLDRRHTTARRVRPLSVPIKYTCRVEVLATGATATLVAGKFTVHCVPFGFGLRIHRVRVRISPPWGRVSVVIDWLCGYTYSPARA